MTTRQTYQKCQAVVSSLNIPRPFSVDALVCEIARTRGRPIYLYALPGGFATNLCGLWVSTHTHDEIYFEEKTTSFHREHIILHEIGHILCDHGVGYSVDPAGLARFLPDLSSSLIERLLGRTDYASEQEQEAELVASLIRTAAGAFTPLPSTGVRGELEVALGIREQRL
ncbi:MAG: hypothetical protein ACRDRU_22745 [Pseudonocardiaceae bacterium]